MLLAVYNIVDFSCFPLERSSSLLSHSLLLEYSRVLLCLYYHDPLFDVANFHLSFCFGLGRMTGNAMCEFR